MPPLGRYDMAAEIIGRIDPGTGRDFAYHVAGEKATLSGPPLPNEPANPQTTPSYELRLER